MSTGTDKRVLELIDERIYGYEPAPRPVVMPDATLDDLGFDSLDTIELTMAVEEEWTIDIPEEECFEQGHAVKDICAYVAKRVKAGVQ